MTLHDLARALNEAGSIADPAVRAGRLGALARQHDLAPAWWNYAATLLELGRTDEARAALLRSLALDGTQRDRMPPRLLALVDDGPAPTPQPVAVPPRPNPVATPAPRGMPSPRDVSPTLIDPVESRVGMEVAGDLRLDVLVHRSASQALYAGSRSSGPVLVRQLLGLSPQAARRAFERERRAPPVSGCARVLDVVVDRDGTPLALLPPLRGELLADRLRAGPLPPRAALALVRGVAQILEELRVHGASVGDVHPEIVLFDEATEAVTLLGASPLASAWGGTLVASPARLSWAPPEEGLEDGGTASAEVYHLGLLLLACMTGGDVPRLAERIGAEWPRWVERALAQRGAAWSGLRSLGVIEAVVRRCLSPRPADRYPGPGPLASELAEAAGRFPVELRGQQGTLFDPVADNAGGAVPGTPPRAGLVERAAPRGGAPARAQAPGWSGARLWAVVLGGAVVLGVVIGGLIQLLRG